MEKMMSPAQLTVSPEMTGQEMREYYLEKTRQSLTEWEQENWNISDSSPFDLENDEATSFTITPELAKKIDLRYQVEVFAEEAKVSTAGVRENQNVLCPWDHRYRINEYMFCLMAEAQTRLVRELQAARIAAAPDVTADEVARRLGDSAKVIEEIFGRSLEDAIKFVKSAPVRAVGGEVRSNTPRFTDLMSRIYAAHGLPVLLTEDPHCKDTSNIYLWSFLVYQLGLSGGDYFTSSHGAPQKQSDKILAPDGAQYLPPKYSRLVAHVFDILKEIEEGGYTVNLAARNDKNLIRTLSYKRLAKIYGDYLRTGPASEIALDKIRQATEKGLRLGLDFFGGSGYKSLHAVFCELGIEKVFDGGYLRTEEDSFFHNIGFRVAQKKDGSGYEVVHDSVDASVPGVVRSANYENLLADAPIGKMVFNVDPDADRFVVGQVLPKSEGQALDDLGISYIKIGDDRLFAILSPNQFFLLLAENDRLIAQEDGSWNSTDPFDIHTYVSALAWDEWAEHHNIPVVRVPVGFKEIAAIVRQVEEQMQKSGGGDVVVTAEAGQSVNLGKNPKLHHAGEESGGKIGGPTKPIDNLLGQKIVAVREKSSGEACVSAVCLAARLYLDGGGDDPEGMFLNRLLAQVFADSGVKNPMEYRGDIIHYNEAIFDPTELAEAKKAGIAERVEFNAWFENLANALNSGEQSLDDVQATLTSSIPGLKTLWASLESITAWSDGLQFWFVNGNERGIRDICIRPSGTDAKTKIYFDGTDKSAMVEVFENHLQNFRPA
jgi:phosphomannomutase